MLLNKQHQHIFSNRNYNNPSTKNNYKPATLHNTCDIQSKLHLTNFFLIISLHLWSNSPISWPIFNF